MRIFCTQCGAQVQSKAVFPECEECARGSALFVPMPLVNGQASQTGLCTIPEAAKRACWWTQGEPLTIARERYART